MEIKLVESLNRTRSLAHPLQNLQEELQNLSWEDETTRTEKIIELEENIKAKETLEEELANSKKRLAKLNKKFTSFRDETQSELEQKDEDISRLLDRVAEIENLRRSESQNADEEIRRLTEEAEQRRDEVMQKETEEIVSLVVRYDPR